MPSATKRVAVIGAGISGVLTAAHLKKEGLEVTVFERSSAAGGVWLYDERIPLEPAYSTTSFSYPGVPREASNTKEIDHVRLLHAPPGPCYVGLKNNVPTRMMETTLNRYPAGTEDFVSHNVLKNYIQNTSIKMSVHEMTQYDTEVRNAAKLNSKWSVETMTLRHDKTGTQSQYATVADYDAVVVASGHYHAAKIPGTRGLADWKQRWPNRIMHSKSYRSPENYRGMNVLLIGGSVSATDIARELGPVAKTIYQSHRNGAFDLPATLLPEQIIRVDEVVSYDIPKTAPDATLDTFAPIPATVTLKSGQKLCDIHLIILCTGYEMTLPFLPQYTARSSNTTINAISPSTIVTSGTQFHNLHRDIFYIPDPTLCFVGVPFFTATFTLFEFQAMVVAKVLSGQAKLPSAQLMRDEYEEKVRSKGLGKAFHSLKDKEVEYVNELLEWVNADLRSAGEEEIEGHTEVWHKARAEITERMKVLFNAPVKEGRGVEVTCL